MSKSFQELFSGSDKTHGHWSPEGGYLTQSGPALEQDYLDHLSGKVGLGLVPVRVDGTCVFGALDIDVDTIDHQALYAKVTARNLPLNVCRSKSGGAHLYVFFNQPMQATLVQKLLKRWAGLIGFPDCEIFPKQTKIDDKNLGNWINLPYAGGDFSLRYCQGPNGSKSLSEFLDTVLFYDPNQKIDDSKNEATEELIQIMPPCLNKLTRSGSPEGVRNQALLNFAIFFRKAYPNGWEDKVKEHNKLYFTPPLDDKEVRSILKSVGSKKYQYTCKVEPLCSRCDRATCIKLEHGVNNMPWDEAGSFDEFTICNLRKIDTKPPRYKVEVNGHDVEMGTDELRNYQMGFKKRIFEELNLVLQPMKQEVWDQRLREAISTITIIEAPADASISGMVMLKVLEFAALSERARKVEDLLKGIPYREGDTVFFRSLDLQRYLQSARFSVENQILYQLLMAEGGSYRQLEVNGKKVMVWSIPVMSGALQTQSFEEAKFDTASPDL